MLLNPTRQAVLAELVGTAVLVCAVVGSGISATRMTDDMGLRLLVNALATVGALGVVIAVTLPVSGAHLNPVVTLVAVMRRRIGPGLAVAYALAQVVGAAVGTMLAHGMYEHPVVAAFDGARDGSGRLLGEVVATAGLVLVVLLVPARTVAVAVPVWIGAAYFVTSSTSFANPAVTVGRALTDTFAGIAWSDVPWFVSAQVIGAFVALALASGARTREVVA